MVEVIAIEIIDHGRKRAGADEGIQNLVVKEYIHRRHGLIGVVLTDDTHSGFGVIGLADAGQ